MINEKIHAEFNGIEGLLKFRQAVHVIVFLHCQVPT